MTPDERWMARALTLARRASGQTSPNPRVGALLVRDAEEIGRGWHRRAGQPHAEIEALADAGRRGHSVSGATIHVTLEPCCTYGRTPPCTDALIRAGLSRVVVGAVDPNPRHAGHGLELLRQAGLTVESGVLEAECRRLNEAFNHWIVHKTPWVVAKSAMTLDGRIATASGESKWITGPESRAQAHRLRLEADAILVGVETVLADDPSLNVRAQPGFRPPAWFPAKRRIVLDTCGRTPLGCRLVSDEARADTRIVVGESAPPDRVAALRDRVSVLQAPEREGRIDLRWLMTELGREGITHLLVEGGGSVLASFFEAGLVHRTAFFYAPRILGGDESRRAVAGRGFRSLAEAPRLVEVESERFGEDLFITARVARDPGT
ncbi:MAG: bifunctional diaminohydroxyphosphoribosylaminopyrimidine deaminase/5-amino-6-(5-phosphoribosylamino)uracil reductase RibD [Verrucomicrobiota bacterium]